MVRTYKHTCTGISIAFLKKYTQALHHIGCTCTVCTFVQCVYTCIMISEIHVHKEV